MDRGYREAGHHLGVLQGLSRGHLALGGGGGELRGRRRRRRLLLLFHLGAVSEKWGLRVVFVVGFNSMFEGWVTESHRLRRKQGMNVGYQECYKYNKNIYVMSLERWKSFELVFGDLSECISIANLLLVYLQHDSNCSKILQTTCVCTLTEFERYMH